MPLSLARSPRAKGHKELARRAPVETWRLDLPSAGFRTDSGEEPRPSVWSSDDEEEVLGIANGRTTDSAGHERGISALIDLCTQYGASVAVAETAAPFIWAEVLAVRAQRRAGARATFDLPQLHRIRQRIVCGVTA